MSEWSVVKIWWDHAREILKFRLVDEDGQKFRCGITQQAINSHFGTAYPEEAAEESFWNNEGEIVAIANSLFQQDAADADDLYLITSDTLK
ncbi:DUF1488 family protein [Marinobacter psychrophilus]|uniref:DUF1488 family protein n=1 Tax=Marinobacter psychrophilus TaxID=330734 RepID=UPI001B6B17A1|nr:DUF1488 family protein [Marinobacter psychrophilus]MBQ0761856.1 DUF1488 family protein [Marinobacter psychrophilus]MBQ0845258.1 DUF1488 family protein [Marinobacter psychrophilus]